MFIDGERASNPPADASGAETALAAFFDFLERRTGVTILRQHRETTGLDGPLMLADRLAKAGVITDFGPMTTFADEPPLHLWHATCPEESRQSGGGASFRNGADALYAALAEALERYLWSAQTDHFGRLVNATKDEIAKHGVAIVPERFVGYSDEQRAGRKDRDISAPARFQWAEAHSLVTEQAAWVPAQIMTGVRFDEPSIRPQITNGLATASTKTGAQLRGALELIERDAYMIMWLNQLTLPRLSLESLARLDPKLASVLTSCERYRLRVYVVPLLTDAPTDVIMSIVEDMSGAAPRFSVGLKAHRHLATAVERSITEALRARRAYRVWAKDHRWTDTPVERIGHRDRMYFWAEPKHSAGLECLIAGAMQDAGRREWADDTEAQHLARIIAWCRERGYECVTSSLTRSEANPTDLHVEMVAIPELQPAYLTEATRLFGGTRLFDIPERFGYTARAPYTEAPHPFS